LKSFIFWHIMSCRVLKINHCFRGKCCLHFQGRRVSQAGNKQSLHFPLMCQLISNRLRDIMSLHNQHCKKLKSYVLYFCSYDRNHTMPCQAFACCAQCGSRRHVLSSEGVEQVVHVQAFVITCSPE
jgi:hypothetical protein